MITVFTSCYNQGMYLPEAVESVLCQTYEDFEYLLIDDGCTDDTADIISKYSKIDKRIIPLILKKGDNVGCVINKSVSIMRGAYWVWVPSDDIIHKDLLSKKIQIADDNSIVFGWGDIINSSSNSTGGTIKFSWDTNQEFINKIWKECFIGMTGIMISKNLFDRVGLFPEHLKFNEDLYWLLKLTMFNNVNHRYTPNIVYKKRVHPYGLTGTYRAQIEKNVIKIKKEIKENYTIV